MTGSHAVPVFVAVGTTTLSETDPDDEVVLTVGLEGVFEASLVGGELIGVVLDMFGTTVSDSDSSEDVVFRNWFNFDLIFDVWWLMGENIGCRSGLLSLCSPPPS